MITDATRRLFADHNFRLYSIGSVVSWLSFFAQTLAALLVFRLKMRS